MYIVVPARVLLRFAWISVARGRNPEPTKTEYGPELLDTSPTAGSDQVCPTLFSAADAVALRSPYASESQVPETGSQCCAALSVGSKLL